MLKMFRHIFPLCCISSISHIKKIFSWQISLFQIINYQIHKKESKKEDFFVIKKSSKENCEKNLKYMQMNYS